MTRENISRVMINLLAFTIVIGSSLSQESDVYILCGSDDTCVKSYNNSGQYAKIFHYDGSEILSGTLHHRMKIASDGKCFTPKFEFRGMSDWIWASWDLPELDFPKPVKTLETGEELKEFFMQEGTPDFFRKRCPKPILCQNIIASREIKYKPCKKGKVGRICQAGLSKDGWCRRYYLRHQFNPVTNWLNKKADTGNYPIAKIANDTHISIDWGKAVTFKCGENIRNKAQHINGFYNIELTEPEKKKKSKTNTITHDSFTFEKDYIEIKKLTTLEDPKCYTFSLDIFVNLWFPTLPKGGTFYGKTLNTQKVVSQIEKLSTKIYQSTSSNGPNGNNDLEDNSKIKTVEKTKTYLFIQHEDKEAPINCLQKKVIVKNMNNNKKYKVDIIEKRKVDLTSYIAVKCEETKIKIRARNTANELVIEKYYTFLPTVNADKINTLSGDGAGHLIVNEVKFEDCENLKFEVVCEAYNEASDKNTTNREILGYNNITKNSDEFNMEGRCKARAFLCEGTNEICSVNEVNSEWTYFYGQPSAKVGSNTAIGSVIGSIFGVLVIAAAVVMFIRFKEKKNREEDKEKLLEKVKVKSESGPIPEHVVFQKDDNLGNYLLDITNLQAEVIEEFNALEKYDEENIKGKETTNTATTQLNLSRNRYKDMVPYDSKLVLLNRATGDPPSRYINASIIKFPTWDQKFLAVQAPKQNMFSGFWQLVMEHNVTVIAMITGLVEGGRVKAHQYWPDENNTKIMLDNGIEVELISVDKTRSVYHHRQFKVTNLSNVSMTVDLLLCVLWEDMTAPKDTKVLRDLVEQTDLLADDNPGTIMVHCSAGVGRTGTFIGYYKMTQDNDNDEVDRIDPFETVLEMRRARTKMVQKPLQYHYMMKCLSDYVTGETSVYS